MAILPFSSVHSPTLEAGDSVICGLVGEVDPEMRGGTEGKERILSSLEMGGWGWGCEGDVAWRGERGSRGGKGDVANMAGRNDRLSTNNAILYPGQSMG